MITYVCGNLFDSPAQVITNTVNCVGVMGKGIALEFKKRFPAMFDDYVKRCRAGGVKIGRPYLWEDDSTQILNFPTKRHWRESSRLVDIEDGLRFLVDNCQRWGIGTLALPPLGCGNGGLKWEVVRPLVEKYLVPVPALEVFVYAPAEAAAVGDDVSEEFDFGREPGDGHEVVARDVGC